MMDAIVDPDQPVSRCIPTLVTTSASWIRYGTSNSDERWLEQISAGRHRTAGQATAEYSELCGFVRENANGGLLSEIGISQAQVSRLEKSAIACIKREM